MDWFRVYCYGRENCWVELHMHSVKDLQAFHWINVSCEVGGCVIATHLVCHRIGDVVH